MLETQSLYCGYNGKNVIDGLSLSVNNGEIFSVTGINGCGKTTLLRALTGIIPYSGSAVINGCEINRMRRDELSRVTALLTQGGAGTNYSDFTVYETVLMGRYVHKKSGFITSASSYDREFAEHCLEKTGMADLRDRAVTELSGGQLQRVLLARAFAQEPEIIFLDEPSNHLDLKHRFALSELLREWVKDGKSVVGVFHDLSLAAFMSDRLMLMNNGKSVLCGNAREVCRSSELSEVYGFDVTDFMRKTLEIWI